VHDSCFLLDLILLRSEKNFREATIETIAADTHSIFERMILMFN